MEDVAERLWGPKTRSPTSRKTRQRRPGARVKNCAELVLTPSEAFLNDPAVTYRLVVDPDISSVTGVRDAYVNSGEPTIAHNEARLLHGTYNGTWKYGSYLQVETRSYRPVRRSNSAQRGSTSTAGTAAHRHLGLVIASRVRGEIAASVLHQH
jgi:hypothetical protein